MSVLELKSELHEIIVLLHSEKALQKILQSAQEAIEEEDLWDALSEDQIDRLRVSIAPQN
jgi:hypothetical protein